MLGRFMGLFNKVAALFRPKYSTGSRDEVARDTSIVLAFSSIICGVFLSFAITNYLRTGHLTMAKFQVGFSLLALVANFVHKFSGKYTWAANTMMFSGVGLILSVAFFTGGITSPVVFWSPVAALGAGMISGRKSIIFWVGLLCLFFIGFSYFDPEIKSRADIITDPEMLAMNRTRAIYGTLILSAALTYLYISIIEGHIAKSKSNEDQVRTLLKIVSHDISTPLMVITGSVKRLQSATSDEREVEQLQKKMERSVIKINQILSKVRELEAFNSGKKKLLLQPTGVLSCVSEAIAGLEDKLQSKNIDVYVGAALNSQIQVLADPTILTNQIITNLLSNAIKFSPEGESIYIRSKLKEDHLELIIEDHGIGIPENLLQELFNMHTSTSRLGTQGESGTGFGLPLVKMFVENFGGTIEIFSVTKENSEKTGTRITLTLILPESALPTS